MDKLQYQVNRNEIHFIVKLCRNYVILGPKGEPGDIGGAGLPGLVGMVGDAGMYDLVYHFYLNLYM
jgi:hypothetical protein